MTTRRTMRSGLLNAPTLMGVHASEIKVAAAIKSRTLLVKLPPLTEGAELRTKGVAALQERCGRFLTNQHLLATLAMDVFSHDLRRASQMTLDGWCGLHTEAEGVVPAAMLSTVRLQPRSLGVTGPRENRLVCFRSRAIPCEWLSSNVCDEL